MVKRSPDQRNDDYLMEAVRAGIHKPILAALHQTHQAPPLATGEAGLGIAPANRIPPSQVKTFQDQVKYAANTVRSLTNMLTADGWQGQDFWEMDQGRYSDRFLRRVAEGYSPPATDGAAARLEPSDAAALIQAYSADWQLDYQAAQLPDSLASLDSLVIAYSKPLLRNYDHLGFQRQALLEAVRLWRKLDTHQEAALSLENVQTGEGVDETRLDKALLEAVQQMEQNFTGYPHQREALLRLVQLMGKLESREAAVGFLLTGAEEETPSDHNGLTLIEPALVAFAQTIPKTFVGKGEQRFALTEGYRLWQGLDSRTAAIQALGLEPETLVKSKDDPDAMAQAATQIDQALLNFWSGFPNAYTGSSRQREAVIEAFMGWHQIEGRPAAYRDLIEAVRRMAQANRHSPDAMPTPQAAALPARPEVWTPETLVLWASIAKGGSFTWAEATCGGTHMPEHQAAVDAIVRLALLAQEARDRIGRPFLITHWYLPNQEEHRSNRFLKQRYPIGDALSFGCEGLTGQQLYWALDVWWPGALGWDARYPYLCYIDARGYQARWQT